MLGGGGLSTEEGTSVVVVDMITVSGSPMQSIIGSSGEERSSGSGEMGRIKIGSEERPCTYATASGDKLRIVSQLSVSWRILWAGVGDGMECLWLYK